MSVKKCISFLTILCCVLLVSDRLEGHEEPLSVETPAASLALAPETESAGASAEGSAWILPTIKAVGGFGIVLMILIGVFWAARKYLPQFFPFLPSQGAPRALRLVESISMGDKRSVALVEVGEDRFLLGNTSAQITLLASMNSSPGAQPSKPHSPVADIENRRFQQIYEVARNPEDSTEVRPRRIPDSVRNKMKELRATLEA